MASSRLEKIGTIYTRVTGLLRSGAMKEPDTPIWYPVYKAFPPQYEPKYDRPAPNITIPSLFYLEDEIRARFHKQHKLVGTVDMSNTSSQTRAQKLISHYKQLQEEGNISEPDLYDSAFKLINDNALALKEPKSEMESSTDDSNLQSQSSLASSFRKAQGKSSTGRSRYGESTKVEINLKDIFKD